VHPDFGVRSVTRYESIRHLLKQAIDTIDADKGLTNEGDAADTIAKFRDRVQAMLTQLDSPGGQDVDTEQVARELFGLLRDCTGPLIALRPVFEDMVSVTKTVSDDPPLG